MHIYFSKATVVLAAFTVVPALAEDLRFKPAGNEFHFDTGVIRGTLRGGGKSDGLTQMVHVRSGKAISKGHGLGGFYRAFAANHRYMPDSWSVPSEASLRDDGSVEVYWPASETRPFEQWATYKWSSPAALDIEIRVRPQTNVKAFEVFLASYFADQFNTSKAAVNRRKPAFVEAEKADGDWQMFPRDKLAVSTIEDGRWKYPPNPVDWRIRPELAMPLGLRRDAESGLSVLIMAPAKDCFAVSMPFQTEGHLSLYLSLFGRDIKSGETARARARLVFGEFRDDAEMLNAYNGFMRVK